MPTFPANMTIAQGVSSTLAVGANFPVTNLFEIQSESLKARTAHVVRDGIRGMRDVFAADVAAGTIDVSGSITIEPTAQDLAFWLPYILGCAAVGANYALGEQLPSFVAVVNRVNGHFAYDGLKVGRATFGMGPNRYLTMGLEVAGVHEYIDGGNTISGNLSLSGGTPYLFQQATLNLGNSGNGTATSREMESFNLTIENSLNTGRYLNSQVRTALPEGERHITMSVGVPWDSLNTDLYNLAVSGVPGNVTLVGAGNMSTVFSFGCLQVPPESPVIQGKGEILLPLNFTARRSPTGTASLQVTHTVS